MCVCVLLMLLLLIHTGEVAYEVHSSGNKLNQVNSAISQEGGVLFEGVWLLVVNWVNLSALYNDEVSC